MTAEQIIKRYEQLHDITKSMLRSARDEDWDAVIRLEQQCQDILEPLIAAPKLPALTDSQREYKSKILSEIIADDAQIRQLTSAWMQQMQIFLGQSARQRSVQRAYNV
jgi:flagellar protein FliT